MSVSEEEIRSKYRIVSNGEDYKVQKWSWWSWRDVHPLGAKLMIKKQGESDRDVALRKAEEILEEFVREDMKRQGTHEWREVKRGDR